MQEIKQLLTRVKAFAFDVDGVFTDSTVWLHPGGSFMRMMNIKDGFAVQHAIKMGYHVAIITGGHSATVKKRFRYLGVKDIYMKSASKRADFEKFCDRHHLAREHVLYMGDDLPDYEVMKMAKKQSVAVPVKDAMFFPRDFRKLHQRHVIYIKQGVIIDLDKV